MEKGFQLKVFGVLKISVICKIIVNYRNCEGLDGVSMCEFLLFIKSDDRKFLYELF